MIETAMVGIPMKTARVRRGLIGRLRVVATT
jgi:hypothetical protein